MLLFIIGFLMCFVTFRISFLILLFRGLCKLIVLLLESPLLISGSMKYSHLFVELVFIKYSSAYSNLWSLPKSCSPKYFAYKFVWKIYYSNLLIYYQRTSFTKIIIYIHLAAMKGYFSEWCFAICPSPS